jgi:PAS domain S-box-containing protein
MVEQFDGPIDEVRACIYRALECMDGNSSETRVDLIEARRILDEIVSAQSRTSRQTPAVPDPQDGEERQAYLADLINHVHDAIVATDANLKITAWNRAAEELYGWKASEVIGRHIYDTIRTNFTDEDHQAAQQRLADTGRFESTMLQYNRDGQPLEIESSGMTIRDRRGKITGFVAANRDLTGRRQMETALRESQERLLLATGAAGIGTWDWNLATGEFNLGPRAREILGVRPEDPATAERLLQAIHPDAQTAALQEIRRVLAEGQAVEYELRVLWPDESEHWIYVKGQAALDAAGQPVRMTGVVMDMSLRREAELESRKAAAQAEVQHRLMDLRERERMAIARDLHDGPVQDLIAISFGLQGALQEADDPDLAGTLQGLRKALHEQITVLRNYAGELRPPALAKFGLEKAVRSHAEQFQMKHPEIKLVLKMHQVGPLTTEPVRLALYRIYQEALNNIVRHSQATEVLIRFEKDERQAEFEIRDNGTGFILPRDWLDLAREGHLGLVGIQERAEAVGGIARFSSSPGKGTSILIRVPGHYVEPPTRPTH